MLDVIHDLEVEIECLKDNIQDNEKDFDTLSEMWKDLKHWLNEWNKQLTKPKTAFLEYHSTEKTLTAILDHMSAIECGDADD